MIGNYGLILLFGSYQVCIERAYARSVATGLLRKRFKPAALPWDANLANKIRLAFDGGIVFLNGFLHRGGVAIDMRQRERGSGATKNCK